VRRLSKPTVSSKDCAFAVLGLTSLAFLPFFSVWIFVYLFVFLFLTLRASPFLTAPCPSLPIPTGLVTETQCVA
jgi:hypothetical protein